MATTAQILDFRGNEVRVVEIDGKVWFFARDVGRVLGLAQPTVSRFVKRLPKKYKGITSSNTPGGGVQNQTIISKEAVYKMIMRSDKPQAEPFQDWVSFEVLPAIEKDGHYFAEPQSELEMIAKMMDSMSVTVKKMIEHERTLKEHDQGLADHEGRILYMEDRAERNAKKLKTVERSALPAPKKTTRDKLIALVNYYVESNDLEYRDVWRMIYREYDIRCHRRIYQREANAKKNGFGKNKLDIIEELGDMEKLFAIASEICV